MKLSQKMSSLEYDTMFHQTLPFIDILYSFDVHISIICLKM